MTYIVVSWYSDGSDGWDGPTIDIAPNDVALMRAFDTIAQTSKRFRVFSCEPISGVNEISPPRKPFGNE